MYSEEVRELLAEFNLQVDSNAPANTRGAILSLIASLHPDKTGGSFAGEAQKEKFDRAMKLRDLFDNEMSVSTQMVTIQQVTSLIEAIAKAQALTQVKDQPSEPKVQEQFRRSLKRKYAFPKITSALIATLCFTLFTFMGNFKNSPLYWLAVNIFTNSKKVEIINRINREGGRIKMRVADILQSDYTTSRSIPPGEILRVLWTSKLINRDDWPNAVPSTDSQDNTAWLEQNTAIGDIDLYSSDEQELFKPLEKITTQIEKALSPGVTALSSELKRRETSYPDLSEPKREKTGNFTFHFLDQSPYDLDDLLKELSSIQRRAQFINQNISELREGLPKAKKRALDSAEKDILLGLAVVTVFACCAFIVIWFRERSDQRWVEFVSSDEGLELVFTRLCTDKEIASRTPPKFQLSEFTQILAKKDVPRYLATALGEHLDGKELSQVASSLIARLKETKVINQVKAPTIQQWFEITAVDFTDADKTQGGSLQKGAGINAPEGRYKT